jgi:predicted MFS family arabinose efflux permease
VLIGLAGLAASLAVLPSLAGMGLMPALIGVVLMVATFEFGLVSLLPLASELAPTARATLLSLNISAFSLGRFAGAAAGGWLWERSAGSLAFNAAAGAGCALVAAILVVVGIPEVQDQDRDSTSP